MKWMAQQAMQQTGEGRSPCGERGLKSLRQNTTNRRRGRSPCGERGLKLATGKMTIKENDVAPRAGSVD